MARRFLEYLFSGHVRDTSSTAPRRANASTEESEGRWSRPGACAPAVGGAGDSSPSAVPCPWYSSAWSPAQPPHVSAGLCQRGRGLPPVRAPALYRVFSPAPRPSLGASAGGDAGTGLGAVVGSRLPTATGCEEGRRIACVGLRAERRQRPRAEPLLGVMSKALMCSCGCAPRRGATTGMRH